MTASQLHLRSLHDRGFDQTTRSGKSLRPRCSQCEVLVINGTAAHEHGCPNAVHECRGCNVLVPITVRYCEECRS